MKRLRHGESNICSQQVDIWSNFQMHNYSLYCSQTLHAYDRTKCLFLPCGPHYGLRRHDRCFSVCWPYIFKKQESIVKHIIRQFRSKHMTSVPAELAPREGRPEGKLTHGNAPACPHSVMGLGQALAAGQPRPDRWAFCSDRAT